MRNTILIVDDSDINRGLLSSILEQDYTRMKSQFDSVEKSMQAFKKFNGIEWN